MSIVNLPNLLTSIRIAIVPLLAVLILQKGYFLAFLVFIFASLTDLLDGFFARLLGQKTAFGSWFDPFADKLFFTSVLIILIINDQLPIWFGLIIVLRDLVVVIGSILSYFKSGVSIIRPHITGKLVILFLFMIFTLKLIQLTFEKNIPDKFIFALLLICSFLSISSLIFYIVRYKKLIPHSSSLLLL